MIKHVVLFQLDKNISQELRDETALQFKQGIEALPKQISCIQKIEVGLNVNQNESWDICLVSEFLSIADLHTYANHPAHLQLAALIKPIVAARSCVDYETV